MSAPKQILGCGKTSPILEFKMEFIDTSGFENEQ